MSIFLGYAHDNDEDLITSELRHMCAIRFVTFTEVDLCWGIRGVRRIKDMKGATNAC
jgi:hypothetical protein